VELVSGYSKHLSDLEALAELVAEIRSRPPRKPKPVQPKQAQNRLNAEEAKQLVTEYQAGATIHGLARQFNVRRETVRGHLRRHGVERRPHGFAAASTKEAVRLYGDGWTLARLGHTYGVDPRTVATALRQAGVQIRDSRFQER
jgi:hypothetical protein